MFNEPKSNDALAGLLALAFFGGAAAYGMYRVVKRAFVAANTVSLRLDGDTITVEVFDGAALQGLQQFIMDDEVRKYLPDPVKIHQISPERTASATFKQILAMKEPSEVWQQNEGLP